jgi:uncharacterized metal-binding protein YceD (DUF177 family)
MTGEAQPEFSRPAVLARLGAEPFRQEIAATEEERAALAQRFDLIAVDRLSAVTELVRRGSDMVLLRATFSAEFVQSCVVSLDPVAGVVSEEFTLLFAPPEMEAEAGRTVEDEIAFEPLVGNTIDVGEAVAQQFSLALPPFPRSPGAAIEEAAPAADESGPIAAALARLLGNQPR